MVATERPREHVKHGVQDNPHMYSIHTQDTCKLECQETQNFSTLDTVQ